MGVWCKCVFFFCAGIHALVCVYKSEISWVSSPVSLHLNFWVRALAAPEACLLSSTDCQWAPGLSSLPSELWDRKHAPGPACSWMLGMELMSLYCKQRISIGRLLSHKRGICLTAHPQRLRDCHRIRGRKMVRVGIQEDVSLARTSLAHKPRAAAVTCTSPAPTPSSQHFHMEGLTTLIHSWGTIDIWWL